MPAVRVQLCLLGLFRLLQGDEATAGFDQARLQHLLAYVVLHCAAPISRQQHPIYTALDRCADGQVQHQRLQEHANRNSGGDPKDRGPVRIQGPAFQRARLVREVGDPEIDSALNDRRADAKTAPTFVC